jgi:hypothetical protein
MRVSSLAAIRRFTARPRSEKVLQYSVNEFRRCLHIQGIVDGP